MSYHEGREAYRYEHPDCQLCPVLKKLQLVPPFNFVQGIFVHHICIGRRNDVLTNWCCVCSSCHDWIHANPKLERPLVVWIKLRASEFDPVEYHAICGKYVDYHLDIARLHDLPVGMHAMISDCELMLKGLTE